MSEETPGYLALLVVDPVLCRPHGRSLILAPTPVAQACNQLRKVLDVRSAPEAFVQAALPLPIRFLPPELRAPNCQALGIEYPEVVNDLYAAPVPPKQEATEAKNEAEAEATAVPEPLLLRDPPEPQGCMQDVFGPEAFAGKVAKFLRMQQNTYQKNSSEAAELRQFKEIADRGPARLVRLVANWQPALAALAAQMPNFGRVIERIQQQCAMAQSTGTPLRLPPILLLGAPGVGKTLFAQQLAAALSLPSFRYNLENAESNSVLLGSERHWSTAHTGELYRLIVEGAGQTPVANPLIILDELDKAPAGQWGHYRPRDALLPLLDRSTSTTLRDKCADVVFDGSFVIYIATANALRRIETPMLSRFDIQPVRELTPVQAVGVVRAMHEGLRKELGLSHFGRPEQALVQELALLANPRLIGRRLRRAFARALERDGSRVEIGDLQGAGNVSAQMH